MRNKEFCIVIVRLMVFTLAFSRSVYGGQEKPEVPFARGKPIPITAEILGAPLAPAAHRVTSEDYENDWASVAVGPKRHLAVAWIAFNGNDDRVLLRETKGTMDPVSWSRIEEIAGPGDFFSPAAAYEAGGALWVVWAANEGGNFDLFARQRTAVGWQQPLRLTSFPGSDIAPSLAVDRQGRVWIAWQGFRNGSFDILLARLTKNGLTDERSVTDDPANDWSPALAVGPSGSMFVAWDTYRNRSYDVNLRRFTSNGDVSSEIPVAATPDREANASIAVDAFDRAWVAYDIGEENWGRHVRLHSQRRIGLRCWDGNVLSALPADFLPSLPSDLQFLNEYPQIAFDDKGGLHLAFQHFVSQQNVVKGLSKDKGIFFWYVSATDGKGWRNPVALRESGGRGENRLRLAQAGDGSIVIVLAADGRSFPYYEVPINGEVFVGRQGVQVVANKLPTVVIDKPGVVKIPPDSNSQRPRLEQRQLGGGNYLLAYGDLHRHTDISRCGLGSDGTLTDTYRYGLDVAGLDFLCISDHDQDLGGWRFEQPAPKIQGYAWWRSQKFADVYSLPGRFLALFGYERGRLSNEGGGHKNVIYARRGCPISSQTDPASLFQDLTGREVVVIPHQLADREAATDWKKWSASFERVAEIYQARGSYEYAGAPFTRARQFLDGNSLWDAYRQGVRIGIIASSDHGSTHNAYAGVFVKQFSRDGILEALRQRRTFGATEVVEVIVTIGDKTMGQEVFHGSAPILEISAHCAEPLAQVEIVKDNRFIYSRNLEGNVANFTFQDDDSQKGESSYYYVRVTTVSGALAWSSPIWVTRE